MTFICDFAHPKGEFRAMKIGLKSAKPPLPRSSGKSNKTSPENPGGADNPGNEMLPSRIGVVEKGSLEEEIWQELGALPRSRRWIPRS